MQAPYSELKGVQRLRSSPVSVGSGLSVDVAGGGVILLTLGPGASEIVVSGTELEVFGPVVEDVPNVAALPEPVLEEDLPEVELERSGQDSYRKVSA